MENEIFEQHEFEQLIEYLFKVMDYQDSIGDTDTREWMKEMIIKIAKHTKFKGSQKSKRGAE